MANQFFTNEYTDVVQRLVNEIVNDPATYLGAKYIPSIALPVAKVRTEIIEATGGLTNEHLPGTDPQYTQRFGTRVEEFTPSYYKEKLLYNEQDIMYLRELGQNDLSQRGIRMYLNRGIDQLNRRIEARVEFLRWQAIFTGGFTFMGKTVSFAIPAGNRVFPVGAVWSTNGLTQNNSADPIVDIRYWLNGGTARFRKYVISKMVMNDRTASWILDNQNTRAYLTSYGANPALDGYEINKVLSFLIPGCPPVEVYKGWYQEQTVDATGKILVGDAIRFIPNGKIFFEANLPDGNKVGEFVQTLNLSNGNLDAPAMGKFLVIDENLAAGTKGGPSNPYIDVVGGVYGGVNLYRSFDCLTADTTVLS